MSPFTLQFFDNHTFDSTFNLNVDFRTGLVEIRDLAVGGTSVTADMDNILNALQDEGIDLEQYRVLYRDSRGYWDQIVVADYEVLGCRFLPVHAHSPAAGSQLRS